MYNINGESSKVKEIPSDGLASGLVFSGDFVTSIVNFKISQIRRSVHETGDI